MKLLLLVTLLLASTNLFAKEGDLYKFLWLDPDKKVYVLQNKVFKKANTFYTDIGGIKNLSSDFQNTYGFHFDFGYYLNEEWAIETFYKVYSHSSNDTFKSVKEVNESEPFVRRINQVYGAALIWSPFYGKINTFNKIIYFDWSFGLGVAQIDADSNKNSVVEKTINTKFEKESYTGVLSKTAFKIHVSRHIHFGLELSNTSYQADGPLGNEKKLRHSTDTLLSVGFSF